MDTSSLRLPDVTDPLTAPFWAGTRAGEIRVQQCDDCGYRRWPPAPLCPQCLGLSAEWTSLDDQGTVLSSCVYHRALAPAFRDEIPYAVVYVQLAGGPRMYGQYDGAPGEVTARQPVRAAFRELSPDVTVIRWAAADRVPPAPAAEGAPADEG